VLLIQVTAWAAEQLPADYCSAPSAPSAVLQSVIKHVNKTNRTSIKNQSRPQRGFFNPRISSKEEFGMQRIFIFAKCHKSCMKILLITFVKTNAQDAKINARTTPKANFR
jgi:hypothetical protein